MTFRCLWCAVRFLILVSFVLPLLVVAGCSSDDDGLHAHQAGEHGGIIVSLGRDHYHAESLFADGEFHLFVLGKEETEVIDIETQTVTAFIRPFGDARSRRVTLEPNPQEGDREGYSSRFVGQLPEDLPAKQLLVVIPTITIEGQRYRFSYSTTEPIMPAKVTSEAEKQLYLTAAGLYTDADIKANGNQTASQKFAGFIASHDTNPAPGAKICPITSTLANPQCGWIIDGQEYFFCCPPCVDEFLIRAKKDPDSIQPADAYVQP